MLSVSFVNSQDICRDFRIYNGEEPLYNFGMDTTFNWWAITTPTTDRQRLIVNGEESHIYNSVSPPVFSYDGLSWATFAIDQGVTTLLMRDTAIFLFASEPGSILYSSMTNQLVYTYLKGDIEYAVMPGKTIDMLNKSGPLVINQNATRFAYPVKRGSSFSMMINGRETTVFDRIMPVGFNIENKFVYAAYGGNGWQIYEDERTVSEIYPDLYEFAINREGTVYAFTVRSFNGRHQTLTFSSEYYEPVISKQYEMVNNLVLHPYLALTGFSAVFQTIRYVGLNSAEYFAGVQPGPPRFSWDGEELYFMSCDLDCFVNINGRRFNMKIRLEPGNMIALAPGTRTVAYSTSTSLMVYFLETGMIHSGMMADYVSQPRFNRFDNRYEALGVIGSRLYLLTCAPPKKY
ncbi:MAG: hypothetical protein KIT33_10615 [Candidatus Kapabacteria bacterium]|nr:hypothetical protein [Ignavibacteriota bacterium]MCW5885412.1 hypothetical protein [Candidatus Kapabacteria bacterium]